MERSAQSIAGRLLHGWTVVLGSGVFTLLVFLVLPVVQAIAKGVSADTILAAAQTTTLPPPPSVAEEEPEPEQEEEPPPPELQQELPPLDLSQLELALDPGSGDGFGAALSFKLDLSSLSGGESSGLFSLSELDQRPRAIHQASPILDAKLRRHAPGRVDVVFVVDEAGRVKDEKVMSSSDPVFERAALAAVAQWKFEPGKRNGQSVQFRMRVTVTFPENR